MPNLSCILDMCYLDPRDHLCKRHHSLTPVEAHRSTGFNLYLLDDTRNPRSAKLSLKA